MLKNIIIGVLVLVSAFFIVLANIQAKEAEKQRMIAEEQVAKAQAVQEKLKQQQFEALKALAEAKKAEATALLEKQAADKLREQLKNCK